VRIAVINGPNLNLLGTREPEIYGRTTLAEIESHLRSVAAELGVDIEFLQSNHEGVLVDAIQGLRGRCDGLVLNLGAYSHTSLALKDALAAGGLPYVEVHLSNLFAREPERQRSLLASAARGFVCGFGAVGYELALRGLVAGLRERA
jgi:3-dehydroquinate dehydratase-2